ncbi:MAG: hypothetical protein RLY58_1531 [Pseudomonadota bacterium]|jgi:uncharacterized protein (DUF2147 family)
MFIKNLVLGCGLTLVGVVHAASVDLSGLWRSVDDRTGFSKGIVRMTLEKDGSYSGTIVKTIPRPDYTPKENCQNCPAPYTNKPIIGLKVLTGLKKDPEHEGKFKDAKILDPLSGNIYSAKAHLSSDGRRLSMRGYIGVSMLGRSQSWFRETEETP